MNLAESQTAEIAAHDDAPGPFRLRIVGGDDAGRILEATSGRVTIGSGPRCTIRFPHPDIEPIHCVFVCDALGWTARPWAANTRLNGMPFQDARLSSSDVISVGSIDLEFLDGTTTSESRPTVPRSQLTQGAAEAALAPQIEPAAVPADPDSAQPVPAHAPDTSTGAAQSRVLADLNRLAGDDVVRRLRSRAALARRRARKLLATLRRDRDASRELQDQIADLRRQHKAATEARHASAADLHRVVVQLADAEHRAAEYAALSDAHGQLTERSAELLAQNAQLAGLVDQLTAQIAMLGAAKQELADANSALDERCRRLAELHASECEKSGALEVERAAFADERQLLSQQIAQLEGDLATSSSAAAASQEKVTHLDSSLRALRSAHDELKDRQQRLQKESFDLADRCLKLTAEHDQLQMEFKHTQGECDRAQESARAAAAERDQLRQQLELTAVEIARLTEAAAADAARQLAGEKERDQLRCDCDQLRGQLDGLNNQTEALAAERRSLRGQCDELQTFVAQLRDEATQANAARSQLADENTALQLEQARLHEEFTQARDKASQTAELNAALEGQCARLADESSAATAERDRYGEEVARLRGEAESFAQLKASLSDENGRLSQTLAQAEAERERLHRESADLREIQAQSLHEKLAIAAERDQLREEIVELRRQAKQSADESKLRSDRCRELEEDCQRLRLDQTQVWDKVAHLSFENQRLSDANAHFGDEFAELTAECDKVREQFAELRDEALALRHDEQNLRDANRALAAQLEEADAAASQAREEHSKSEAERSRLALQIESLVNDRDNAREAAERLQRDVQQMSDANSKLAAENQAFEETAARLREGLAQTEDRLERLSAEQAAVAQRLAAADDLERELQLARSREGELAKCLADIERELVDRRQRQSELESQIAEQLAQSATLSQQLLDAEQLRLELEHSQSRERELQQSLADAERAQVKQGEQQAELTERIARLSEENAALVQQLSAAGGLAHELELARARESELVDCLAGVEQELAEHKQQRAELAEQVAQFEMASAATWGGSATATSEVDDARVSVAQAAPNEEASDEPQGWSWRQPGEPAGDAAEAAPVQDAPNWNWASSPAADETSPCDPPRDHGASVPATASNGAFEPSAVADSLPPSGQTDVFPHGDIGAEGANWLAAAAPDQPPAGEPSATVAAPASYIERFTHLFADDADDVPPTAEPRLSQPLPETVTPKPRSMRVAPPENTHSPGSGEADEESIEQYMAKLLQRVRGDTDRPPASQAPPPPIRPERPAAHAGMPLSAPGNSSSRLLSRADSPDSFVPAEAAVTEVRTELRLRAPAPERLADLKALRQLSNETARQAIGVYETRYQRRRTLSRIIVSALAGATGLWLICLAPSWRDPQLISACVLLYIAAHWMTQTLRSNIRLLRARSIEFVTGQSHGDGRPEQLPIDIEDDRR